MAFEDRPSRRVNYSWITQRILNRIPSWSYARSNPTSVAQQLLSPLGEEIQKTTQALIEERMNIFLPTCNPSLLDHLYQAYLGQGFSFTSEETFDGQIKYTPPRVWAMINSVETEIAQAEFNDIETLYYFCLPTRIEGLNVTNLWSSVIPQTTVENIGSVTPNDMVLEGNLFVTLSGNSTWELRFKDTIYYSKIKITGVSRKGTEIEEVVPLRYNGTFKTRNQWKSVTSVYVSHLDSTAVISLSCLPFYEDPVLDVYNVTVPNIDDERIRFFTLASETYGSVLEAKSFGVANMDDVRLGIDDIVLNYPIELLDENGANVNISNFVLLPNSNWLYAIDNDYLFVYDRGLPFPDVSNLRDESSADTRMGVISDKWIYKKNEEATVFTRQIDVSEIPTSNRWSILLPSGTEYRVGLDGSYWPISEDGWIKNIRYDEGVWEDQFVNFTLSEAGEYVITVDCIYEDESGQTTLSTKFMLYVPTIQPEVQLALPSELKNCTNIFLDTDHNLWFYNGTSLLKAKDYHDYFVVDYKRKDIWLVEDYSSIKVEP